MLKLIQGKPILQHIIERCQASKADVVQVATTMNDEDNEIVDLCKELNVLCYRGDADDVLTRYYCCVRDGYGGKFEHVIRITADCPLVDPRMIDDLIDIHVSGKYDITSNCIEETFPDGYDISIMKVSVLKEAWKHATERSDREHVVPWILRQHLKYRIKSVTNDEDLKHWRLTVDHVEDLEVISTIYNALYSHNQLFGFHEVYRWLTFNNHVLVSNSMHNRNESCGGLW